ncbi:hypothetical protein GGH94_003078 [Coemansia aciculifera]|uniref:FAS1 domain-containing protein n=1 Tax=Coemansia aciculifera TaxID=417176 RepID=A0A9W8M643_9FUNG|nr:hypothetical protein GGH94_003078 [Coemansia aciculifera]KAJ2876873.1 hypothetical protein GGH93_000364 [Coemansia aciculifera]
MKFAAVVLALAAAASAQAPPNLEAIMAAMPNDLVAAMSYFPATFIQGIFGGAPMPTDVSALFALAPAIPTADRPKLESQYLQFLAQVAPLLPTPTKPTSASTPSSTPKTTPSPSSSPSSAPSSSNSGSVSGSNSGSNSGSGSSKLGQSSDSVKKTDSSDSNKSSDSHSGDSNSESGSDSSSGSGSSSKNNGAAKVAASLVALVAVAAAGAMF